MEHPLNESNFEDSNFELKFYISLELGSALLDNEIEQRKEVKEGIQGNRRSTGIAHLLLLPTIVQPPKCIQCT